MNTAEKYDKIVTGAVTGFILPFISAAFIFIFAKGDPTLREWMNKVILADISTNIVTLSVFSNIIIFLIYNHFDMLRAARGVLGVTIGWAVVVFGIKFLL